MTLEDRHRLFRIRKDSILNLLFSSNVDSNYDQLIDKVNDWYLEIDNYDMYPTREIAVDTKGNTLFILPFNQKESYWVDNEVSFDFIKTNFNISLIDKIEFEKRWDEYLNENKDKKAIT